MPGYFCPGMDLAFDKRWRDLLKELSEQFDGALDLNAVVFLIGVQELGHEVRTYKKDEKLALMHVAVCTLLEPFGYYKPLGLDADGWPHFELIQELPPLDAKDQERLMKEAILHYFDREA